MSLAKQLSALVLVYLAGELVAAVIFAMLRPALGSRTTETTQKKKERWKGSFERIVLLAGLLQRFPQIIIAFGALKIGTRIKVDEGSSPSNDFFLIGNLVSIFIVLCDYWFLSWVLALQ